MKITAWTLDLAKQFAHACKDHQITWVEEPLDSRDYDGNASLKRVSP